MYAFQYHRPGSIGEATTLLGKLGEGIAFGPTLIAAMKLRLAQPSDLARA